MKASVILSALAMVAAPVAAAPAPVQANTKVIADNLLGLDKGLFDQVAKDILKPWFTNGNRRALGEETLAPWRPLAPLVHAAYCPLTAVEAGTCGKACDVIKQSGVKYLGGGGDNQSNPQWYVVDDGTKLIIVLEGTNGFSLLSWATDLDFWPLSPQDAHFPGTTGRVHKGFYSNFLRQIADVEALLQPLLPQRKQIIITGHSMGAAIGELSTTYLTLKYPDHDIQGMVFAKPRVGDRAWADYVDEKTKGKFRYMQNNADIVAQLPPIELAFRHPAGEIWIDTKLGQSTYWLCDGQENIKCSDSQKAVGWVPNVVIPTNEIAAHLGPYLGVNMGLCGIY